MIAIVAGSGISLRPLLDTVLEERPFGLPGAPELAGHQRVFVRGQCAGQDIVLQLGRIHCYEGFTLDDVCSPVVQLHAMGAREIVFTNAVGALDPALRPGKLVGVSAMRAWPYRQWRGPERVSPCTVIPGLDAGGEYWWMHGPCYETPAEIKALRGMGGTVVGMSTLPEVARAQALGMRTAVISCVTNACGAGPLSHEEVVRTARASSERLCAVLRGYLVGL